MIAQLNREYISHNPSKIIPRLLSYFLYEGRPVTTRGRWFNPLTFSYLRSVSGTGPCKGCESPVFITGTGRSGSTLLGLVLSMHSEVGFLNEPKALWFEVNPKDDLIGSYSTGEAAYIMQAADADAEKARKVKAIYSSFLKRSGSERIVDKFPEMIFRLEYLNALFENPKYIFLYRNATETIASTAMWSNSHRNPNKEEDWWGVKNRKWNLLVQQVVPHDEFLSPIRDTVAGLTNQVDKAAVEWIVTMNRGLKMAMAYPDKVLPVKYEDLCGDIENMLTKICRFTGLNPENNQILFGKKIIRDSRAVNSIRLHPALAEPISELSGRLGYPDYSVSMMVTE